MLTSFRSSFFPWSKSSSLLSKQKKKSTKISICFSSRLLAVPNDEERRLEFLNELKRKLSVKLKSLSQPS